MNIISQFSSSSRAVFLRLVSLAVLLFTLWRQITCEGDTNSGDCKLCKYNNTMYQVIIKFMQSLELYLDGYSSQARVFKM